MIYIEHLNRRKSIILILMNFLLTQQILDQHNKIKVYKNTIC